MTTLTSRKSSPSSATLVVTRRLVSPLRNRLIVSSCCLGFMPMLKSKSTSSSPSAPSRLPKLPPCPARKSGLIQPSISGARSRTSLSRTACTRSRTKTIAWKSPWRPRYLERTAMRALTCAEVLGEEERLDASHSGVEEGGGEWGRQGGGVARAGSDSVSLAT